ncbi:MAG TPA: hypothetical protein VIO14_13615 [Dehalococcoidia bacterium]
MAHRIAYVARVKHGREPECREVQQHMPVGGMRRLGIRSVDAFVGSGYYILVCDYEGPDFQDFFRRFASDPGMRGFFRKLEPHVEGLPSPDFAPGDAYHGAPQAPPGAGVTSSSLPLASHAYHWSAQAAERPAAR